MSTASRVSLATSPESQLGLVFSSTASVTWSAPDSVIIRQTWSSVGTPVSGTGTKVSSNGAGGLRIAGVQGGDLGEGEGPPGHASELAADRGLIDGQVMGQDQGVVGGQRDVELDGVDAGGQRIGEAGQRVLRPPRPRAPVSVDLGHG